MSDINYQQIYEQEVSSNLKESLEKPTRFFELSHQDRLLVEELIDLGYRRCLEDALNVEVLAETAELSEEMASQLQAFSHVVKSYVNAANGAGDN